MLKRLGEIGDIRSAISSLEFLCVKGDEDADWGAKIAFTKPKRGAKETPALTQGEQDSLELVTQREASLGIFHAVGKAAYNKREDLPYPAQSASAVAESLPHFIARHSRPKASQVAVDALIDETGTDTSTFISALHENYALSCEAGPQDPNSSMDYINECIEYLSEADLLAPSWDVFFGGKGYPSGSFGKDSSSHVLRQDEMAFQVAVRGLLFSLPSPVRRQTHPTGGRGGGDAFKMFFPTSIKLWRAREEVSDMIDMWATKMLKGEDIGLTQGPSVSSLTNGSAAFRRNRGHRRRRVTGPPIRRIPATDRIEGRGAKHPSLMHYPFSPSEALLAKKCCWNASRTWRISLGAGAVRSDPSVSKISIRLSRFTASDRQGRTSRTTTTTTVTSRLGRPGRRIGRLMTQLQGVEASGQY